MKDCAYLEGSTIERELKKIIDRLPSNQVKMVVGCPGHGKSTALKKILSERKENSDFFFFTFESIQDQADCEKASKDLLSSLYGIKKIYKGSPLRNKKVKIVIDDINRIQELKDQGFAQRILTLIYTFAQSKSLDLICISSSSTFVEKYYNNNQFNKAFSTFILQSEHSDSLQKQHINKIDRINKILFTSIIIITLIQPRLLSSQNPKLSRFVRQALEFNIKHAKKQ